MNPVPQKIKLEEEVETPPSLAATSRLPDWVSPDSVTDQAIYREASRLFEQLIESYRYRSAGHPVAIKIEEEQNPKERPDLQIAEEFPDNPEIAQRAESETDRQVREHLKGLQRAVRRGTRKATFASHKLFKRGKPSERYTEPPTEESESLADIATRAANTNFTTTSVSASIPIPATDPEPEPIGPVFVEQVGVVQPKTKEWDC